MQRFLLTNGLGGYASLTRDFTAEKPEDGVFVAAVDTPDNKIMLVRRLKEGLQPAAALSLQHFSLDPVPCWIYKAGDILLQRQLVLGHGENTCALLYRLENTGAVHCTFTVDPVCENDTLLYIKATAPQAAAPYSISVAPGQVRDLALVFGCDPQLPDAESILNARILRKKQLLAACPFRSPVARHLYMAADDFIVTRQSDGAKMLLTGYPKNTGDHPLAAFAGCLLATGRYQDAKEILECWPNRNDPLYKKCLSYYTRKSLPQCQAPVSLEEAEDRLTENCLGQLACGDCCAHAASVARTLLALEE